VPQRAREARKAGRLTPDDLDILAFFYGSSFKAIAERRSPTLILSLKQIGEGIRWRKGASGLDKRLRRLEAKPEPWFSHVAEGTGGEAQWAITLYPDAPNPSESCPSESPATCPSGGEAEDRATSGVATVPPESMSEASPGDDLPKCPSEAASCPSTEEGAKPLAERDSRPSPGDAVRVPQKYRKGKNSHRRGENVLGEGPRAVGASWQPELFTPEPKPTPRELFE
jgi:hypothetical protein